MAKRLTDKQRVALAAVEAAKAAGLGLHAYAQANGLNVRQIYDAMAALRKHGLLPPTSTPRLRLRKAAFVAVDVVSGRPPPSHAGVVCRLIHPSDRCGAGARGSTHAGAVVFARFDVARRAQERGADGRAGAAGKRTLGASVDASSGGGCAVE